MSKLFANIKWIGGDDDGKVTVGIPTDWIMNFNHQEFLSENFDPDESYVIDWREAGKKPPGGWPKFDGLILDIAATVQALERKSINYVYPKSPRIVTPKIKRRVHPDDSTQASGSKTLTCETPVYSNKIKKSKVTQPLETSSDEDDENEEQSSVVQTPLSNLFHFKMTTTKPKGLKTRNVHGGDDGNAEDVLHHEDDGRRKMNAKVQNQNKQQNSTNPLGSKNINRQREKSPARNAVLPNDTFDPEVIMDLRSLLRANLNNQRAVQNEEEGMMELGERGSGVKVPMTQWEAAKEQRTFTAMAVCLVMSLFERPILLNSNVKGGRSKIHKAADNVPRHRALDPNILRAITASVRKEFPSTFKKADMHTAINAKLSGMRREQRLAEEAETTAAANAAAAARAPAATDAVPI